MRSKTQRYEATTDMHDRHSCRIFRRSFRTRDQIFVLPKTRSNPTQTHIEGPRGLGANAPFLSDPTPACAFSPCFPCFFVEQWVCLGVKTRKHGVFEGNLRVFAISFWAMIRALVFVPRHARRINWRLPS